MKQVLATIAAALFAVPATAATIPSHCVALSDSGMIQNAALNNRSDFNDETVRIHFIDHATFIIEISDGTTVATDYTGYLGHEFVPDVITMNFAHTSHWTDNIPDGVQHVLRGWGSGGRAANFFVEMENMTIRNVPTDIRNAFGRQIPNGNSIFIFESAGLCIGHLGHLHHEPTDAQYARIGRLDVVMVPVDGSTTMSQEAMINVMERLQARIVIPMHWFGVNNVERFIRNMPDFDSELREENYIDVSLRTLPTQPTIVVLPPQLLQAVEGD